MAEDIAALVAQADLPAIAAAFTELKQRGSEYLGKCCFHQPDNHPSLSLYRRERTGKWLFKCWSCGAAGDALDWIEQLEGLDTAAALKRLNGGNDWKAMARATPAPPPLPERITSKPPAGVASPHFAIRDLGEPSKIWPYKDTDGEILGYVARYETPEGKQIRCWTWGARGSAGPSWGCNHWNKPRPLYALDRLASDPDRPVIVVEGEKTADAAQQLLPAYTAITWPGGSHSWHRADWKQLRGRKVLLWPDNDTAGLECMDKLAALLADPKGLACAVRLIDPNRMPEGWDLADALAEGWDTERTIAWAKPRARDYVPPAAPASEPDDAAGPEHTEIPPEPGTLETRPRRSKPRLATVDGNAALAPDAEIEPLPQAMSEDALADHFATQHGERWRYVKVWSCWFEWEGDGWRRDDTAKISRLAVELTRQSMQWPEAASLTPAGKREVNSKHTAGNVRDLAQHDRRIAATVDQWDRDPWLLGVPGGVVDLRAGKLIEAEPEQYITKRTTVAPAPGECVSWHALLARVTQGDQALLDYLQRLCGYLLTGETREECFAFVYGPAQTGKTTFIRVLSEILGDYHRKASMETFTESRQERHSEELAVLAGARLVTAVETEERKHWNEPRIKALTGRDRIRARFMRENSFEFEPQFKLVIAGNHAPHLRNVDDAMRRRLHIIPFTQPVPPEERDELLADKLRAEYPAILDWMVQGTLAWAAGKLGRPDAVSQAVDSYMESEDSFGQWLAEAVDQDPNGKCLSGGAYDSYRRWAERASEFVMSHKRFVQALRERGFDSVKGAGGARYIKGIALRAAEDAPPAAGYYDR